MALLVAIVLADPSWSPAQALVDYVAERCELDGHLTSTLLLPRTVGAPGEDSSNLFREADGQEGPVGLLREADGLLLAAADRGLPRLWSLLGELPAGALEGTAVLCLVPLDAADEARRGEVDGPDGPVPPVDRALGARRVLAPLLVPESAIGRHPCGTVLTGPSEAVVDEAAAQLSRAVSGAGRD